MLTEKTFDNGSLLINYAEGPASGVPLVLLHGLPSRWQEFQILIPALTEKWHVYALDARGQGKSGRTPGHYYSQYYADDVISFLDSWVNQLVSLECLRVEEQALRLVRVFPIISAHLL